MGDRTKNAVARTPKQYCVKPSVAISHLETAGLRILPCLTLIKVYFVLVQGIHNFLTIREGLGVIL